MTDTPSIVVNRLAELIASVPNIGVVRKWPIRERDDVLALITSQIDGVDTARAWWIHGPTMEGEWLTGMSPQHVRRIWTYEIHGVEGLSPGPDGDVREPGQDIETLRDNAAAISDAIDGAGIDLDLGHTVVFDSEPCRWRQQPFHERFVNGTTPLAYVVIDKRIETMPSRT